jgi:hypothetical protein
MINYPGYYGGILEPWRHYVPLQKDHSNMQDVVEFLRDAKKVEHIIETTYREIALNDKYTYKSFVAWVDQMLEESVCSSMLQSRVPYSRVEYLRVIKPTFIGVLRNWRRKLFLWSYYIFFKVILDCFPLKFQGRVKILLKRLMRKLKGGD